MWVKKHTKKKCKVYKNPGAIGGGMTYSFTPTGLGTIVKVQCGCGDSFDVTDYDNW